jgi:hypothetical protein
VVQSNIPVINFESEQVQTSQGASHGASTSEAQANNKTMPHRKKRKRSLHALLNSIEEDPVESSSSSSEEDNNDIDSSDSNY